MKKLLFFLILFMTLPYAIAHCPLCTATAGAGIAVARFYGVDDGIVGLFVGGLIISSALWFNKWLKKKINLRLQETLIILSSFLLFVIPFYFTGLITNIDVVKAMPDYYSMLGLGIYGVDKLLFGMITGSVFVWGAFTLNEKIKKKKGKILFPYQGVSFMIITLAILSLLFWLITK